MTIAPYDIAISQDITGVEVDNRIAITEYIYTFLNFKATKLSQLNQGTSISGITRDVLITIDLAVPSLAEQERIIGILRSSEKDLNFLNNKLADLKVQKTGMMQKLLTGKVRVKT